MELKEVFPNIVPLEKYINTHTKMKFKCLIHNEDFISTPHNLLEGKNGCKRCQSEAKRNRLLRTNDEFLKLLEEKQIDVIPLERYRGNTTKILFRCSCGDLWRTTPERVLIGNHCKKCGYNKFSGENNHFYNPNLSDEDREDSIYRFRNPLYKNFIHKCFQRDNYTCQITGKKSRGDIVVHHINGYNWDIENRTNVDNGVTLNREIHKEFHKLYGNGNNTKFQFKEFIEYLNRENRITKEQYNLILKRLEKIK
nr:MAG TPA: NinG protein [Caudoviricetes sp.]